MPHSLRFQRPVGWLRVATLAKVGSGSGLLGGFVARQAAGSNGRCASTGGTLQFKSAF